MERNSKSNISNTKKMTLAGLFCALAFICVIVFRFKVQFLTFDIKDAFMVIASFVLGPVWGVGIAFVTAFLEMITVSDTQLYGFIMNVLSSSSFVFVASIIYKYNRRISGAVIGLISGVCAMTAVMMVANLFITPFYYVKVLGIQMDINDVAALIPKLLLPFNLIKGILNAAIAMLLYKPLTNVCRRFKLLPKNEEPQSYLKNKRSIISIVISAGIIIVSLAILFILLNAEMSWF